MCLRTLTSCVRLPVGLLTITLAHCTFQVKELQRLRLLNPTSGKCEKCKRKLDDTATAAGSLAATSSVDTAAAYHDPQQYYAQGYEYGHQYGGEYGATGEWYDPAWYGYAGLPGPTDTFGGAAGGEG